MDDRYTEAYARALGETHAISDYPAMSVSHAAEYVSRLSSVSSEEADRSVWLLALQSLDEQARERVRLAYLEAYEAMWALLQAEQIRAAGSGGQQA
jgi:hypothetical protein